MADRTAQPATEVGPHSAYAANCRFLWNAAVPNKNSLNSSDSTSGLTGTDNTGSAGKYRTFGAGGQMAFSVSLPSGAYTLVVVHAFPAGSVGSAQTVSTLSGTGFQCTPYTTGGGVYENYTHRGAADSTSNQVTGVGSFNTAPWVEVFAFTGSGGSPANQLRRYRKSGSGVETGGSETISYVNPSTTIYLGDGGGANTQGVYAVMLVAGDIGDAECELLRDNPWRMFAEEGGDTTAPILSSPTGTATGSTTATVGATTDEANGTMYAVVTTSATAPSAAQIKAGQDHTGSAAAWNSGSGQAISTTGAKTFSATGLTASTGYYAHLIHTDAAANDSNIVTSAQFTTSAGNSAPSWSGTPSAMSAKKGQALTPQDITSLVSDADLDTLSYGMTGAPTGVTINSSTGIISGTPTAAPGVYACTVEADDGVASPVSSSSFNITVTQCVLALNAAGYEFGDGNDPDTMAVVASTELQVAAYPLTEWPPASAIATATATTGTNGRLADVGDDDLVFGTTYRVIARNAADGETWAWTMAAS